IIIGIIGAFVGGWLFAKLGVSSPFGGLAGPMRFFLDVLLPLSKTSIAALFVIQFIYGWNQYLWPLLVTSNESMYTAVIGIKRMIVGGDAANEWNLVMATAMLALLPPAIVVMLMQKWFVRGLVETEK
ncbi:MAG TPA: ABC transporter permease subunit, partial [Burkholderiales bacterium]|nr:ABC transporter permease subunit [Burkholderiales bacterium]